MENINEDRSDKILILESDPQVLDSAKQKIQSSFPDASLTEALDLGSYRKAIGQDDFDIIIFDYNLDSVAQAHLIQELKIRDNEPAVLLVSTAIDPLLVSEISNSGCQRYLVREGDWLNHLAPAIRQLLRIRRLELENQRLVARLTEAKMFLEEKNKRLDEFSATVAHDIRGPLGAVAMKLEYMTDFCADDMNPRFRELLQRCSDSTRRLIDIVQAMYQYAKLGSKAAKMSELDLGTLVEEVIADMPFDQKLDINIGIDQLPVIWGNKELLRRVFINLLSNAVKYNDKPRVIVNIGLEQIEQRTLTRYAKIFVEDNGPGIPPDEMKDIFSIFGRGESVKSKTEGLGVGLAVVQRIVELHYGKVSLEKAEGGGARFVLSLPLDRIDFLE